MATPGLYLSAHKSVMNICKKFKDDMAAASVATLQTFNFDAAADESEWPEGDLIGTVEFQIRNEVGILEIITMIGISTENDKNCLRLDTMISRLFDRFSINSRFPFLDDQTGAPLGTIVVQSPVHVMPMARTRTRPVKFIGVKFGSDRAF